MTATRRRPNQAPSQQPNRSFHRTKARQLLTGWKRIVIYCVRNIIANTRIGVTAAQQLMMTQAVMLTALPGSREENSSAAPRLVSSSPDACFVATTRCVRIFLHQLLPSLRFFCWAKKSVFFPFLRRRLLSVLAEAERAVLDLSSASFHRLRAFPVFRVFQNSCPSRRWCPDQTVFDRIPVFLPAADLVFLLFVRRNNRVQPSDFLFARRLRGRAPVFLFLRKQGKESLSIIFSGQLFVKQKTKMTSVSFEIVCGIE